MFFWLPILDSLSQTPQQVLLRLSMLFWEQKVLQVLTKESSVLQAPKDLWRQKKAIQGCTCLSLWAVLISHVRKLEILLMSLERNGSEVKSIRSSFRGPRFDSWHSHGGSNHGVCNSSSRGSDHLCTWCTHMHAGKTFLNKNKNKSKNMCLCFNAITDCNVSLGSHFGYLWDQLKCKQQSTPVRDFLDWNICGGKTCPKSWVFNIRRPIVNVGPTFW